MVQLLKYIFLGPFSIIYGAAVTLRNKLYDWHILRSVEFPLPIIGVGNITVGGTGKTPHTELIVSMIKNDMKTAVLSRGYKRESRGFRYVETGDTASLAGDEPLQIKQKFPDITVAVDVNRKKGIERLMADEHNLNVIVLDDAFQYRKVRPSLSILLIDYNRPLQGDRMLPLGRLRDRRNQLYRADIVIVTKCPNKLSPIEQRILTKNVKLYPYQQLYLTTFSYGEPIPVFAEENVDEKRNAAPLLLTGIANPTMLINYLTEKNEAPVNHLIFPDHHAFTEQDVEKINKAAAEHPNSPIYTTEKDAVRLRDAEGLSGDVRRRLLYIPITVCFLADSEQEKFQKFILSYVRKNKRNNILHTVKTKN